MSKYSKEDIIRLVRENDVEFIRMQFTDIFGQLKNVAITASQVEKAVNNEIMIDGSSIEGFTRPLRDGTLIVEAILPRIGDHAAVDAVVFLRSGCFFRIRLRFVKRRLRLGRFERLGFGFVGLTRFRSVL